MAPHFKLKGAVFNQPNLGSFSCLEISMSCNVSLQITQKKNSKWHLELQICRLETQSNPTVCQASTIGHPFPNYHPSCYPPVKKKYGREVAFSNGIWCTSTNGQCSIAMLAFRSVSGGKYGYWTFLQSAIFTAYKVQGVCPHTCNLTNNCHHLVGGVTIQEGIPLVTNKRNIWNMIHQGTGFLKYFDSFHYHYQTSKVDGIVQLSCHWCILLAIHHHTKPWYSRFIRALTWRNQQLLKPSR